MRTGIPGNAGVVVIGRNEGERLKECLKSVIKQSNNVLYVDSGSSDGSAEAARSMGIEVVELDPSLPFNAARARNVGFQRLVAARPGLEFVQFADGDCEMADGWLRIAIRSLQRSAGTAIVCGRLREKDAASSIYRRLLDMEWKADLGEVPGCGGTFMVRVGAFREVGGFKSFLVAGEEPELCSRLRRSGWKIERVAEDMAVHDGEMTCFWQWWRRSLRTGCAYAQGIASNRELRAGGDLRQVASCVVWGMTAPLVTILSLIASPLYPAALWIGGVAIVAIGLLGWRIYRVRRRKEDRSGNAVLYSIFCILGKIPMSMGIMKCLIAVSHGRTPAIIECKITQGATSRAGREKAQREL